MNDIVFVVVCFVAGWVAAILTSYFLFHESIAHAAASSLGASVAIAFIVLYQRRSVGAKK